MASKNVGGLPFRVKCGWLVDCECQLLMEMLRNETTAVHLRLHWSLGGPVVNVLTNAHAPKTGALPGEAKLVVLMGSRRMDPSPSVTGLPLTGEVYLMALSGR